MTVPQLFAVIESTQGSIPDALAPHVNNRLPGYVIEIDIEDNYVRGAIIPNASYNQRFACNFLADNPFWSDKEQCDRVLNKAKWLYDPDPFDDEDNPIIPEPSMIGKLYHIIPFIEGLDGFDEDFAYLRSAYESTTNTVLPFPLGRGISAEKVYCYFKQQNNEL